MQRLVGITWDHPRGTNALRAAANRARDAGTIDITWDAQSLEGFESHPIDDLAARYDLLNLDHPHLGDARAANCLVPLDHLFDSELRLWQAGSVGRSFDSYRDADGQWALPFDAATQVMIRRPTIKHAPTTLDELLISADKYRVVPCYAGPHAALMFMAICVGLGTPCQTSDRAPSFVDRPTGIETIKIMRLLSRDMTPANWTMNPIAMHQAVADQQIDLCPWVYGYAPYGSAGGQQVLFSDVVRIVPSGPLGSTLGGTGLAISKKARVTSALVDHVRWLMSVEAQTGLIPGHSGQPSMKAAWEDSQVNEECGDFYRNTRATTDDAWVRPRWPGYTVFQANLSDILRIALRSDESAEAIHARMNALYQSSVGVHA